MSIICSSCLKEIVPPANSGGTGYGMSKTGPICYACCAIDDQKYMRETGKIDLYLSKERDTYKITNWPGTLKFEPTSYRTGKHNIAGSRVDVWFVFDGYWWHGVQYGEWTQICHCKRTKQAY